MAQALTLGVVRKGIRADRDNKLAAESKLTFLIIIFF
jgi:hypothetical protein